MRVLKKILTMVLILLIFNLYLPKASFSESDEAGVTKHPPEVATTPEMDIPVVKIKEKTSDWTWVIVLGLVGGAAAALGGLGGSGTPSSPGNDSGDVTVSW